MYESSFSYLKRGEIFYNSFLNSKINYYFSDLGKEDKGVVSLKLIKREQLKFIEESPQKYRRN